MLPALKDTGSLPALLGWAYLVDDGVVLLKDGALMRTWRYSGPSPSTATLAMRRSGAQLVSDALALIAGEGMLHFGAIRRPAVIMESNGHFPSPLTQFFDAERREHLNSKGLYESSYYVSLTMGPPTDEAFKGLLSGRGAGINWDNRLSRFKSVSDTLAARMSSFLSLSPLNSDELAAYLHSCLLGDLPRPAAPIASMELSAALCTEMFVGGMEPMMGKKHIKVLSITGFPAESDAGLLDFLALSGGSARWSTRFIPFSPQAANSLLRKKQLMWFQKRRGLSSWLIDIISRREKNAYQMREEEQFFDQDAAERSKEMAGAIAMGSSGEVSFGYHSSAVVLAGEDEADLTEKVQAIQKKLAERGFSCRIETLNAVEAFLGSLPGHGYYNIRRPVISSLNLAHLIPSASPWLGKRRAPAPYLTGGPILYAKSDESPYRLHVHVGDVGHTLVIGKTGAGKSVLVGALASQWLRYRNSRVFLFDLGYSACILTHAAGGRHYDIAAGSEQVNSPVMRPLDSIDNPAERAWALSWLEGLLSLQGLTITPELRGSLRYSLDLLAESPRDERTISGLWAQLRSADLRSALSPYAAGGDLAFLFDSDGSELAGSRLTTFELSHLVNLSDKALLPTLLYLFHEVEKNLSIDAPALIIIEECWAALMQPLFADRIRRWLLTLRKRGASVVLIAHSASQVAGARIITESVATRIALANPDANEAEYEAIGFSSEEVALIKRARMKADYLVSSADGAALIDLSITDSMLAFLSAPKGFSIQEALRKMGNLQMVHGDRWVAEWLRMQGLPAEGLERFLDSQKEESYENH